MKTKLYSRAVKSPALQSEVDIQSVLVPIDFSTSSLAALSKAVSIAKRFNAKLTLLHVVEPIATPDFESSFPLVMNTAEIISAAELHLMRIVREQRIDLSLVERQLVRPGSPFREITETARELKSDLIVIPTHGYTGLRHVLLGSVAERVVRHAPCPVLVLRSFDDAPAPVKSNPFKKARK